MGRWLAVRFAAFGLKHKAVDGPGLWRALGQAFPHRDARWRWAVAGEAIERSGMFEQLEHLEEPAAEHNHPTKGMDLFVTGCPACIAGRR